MTEFFEPTKALIDQARNDIAKALIQTPLLGLSHQPLVDILPQGARAHLKLELFQHAGSFKTRGVYLAIKALSQADKDAGVVAVSAGNHAISTAWAAQAVGVSAKVCLPKTADPFRVALCQELGAEVLLCQDIADAFAKLEHICATEGRTMLHPFESPWMTLGAATCAAEMLDALPGLEAAVIPIGGGGLISGMAAGFKLLKPDMKVFGVEPENANVVSRSLVAGTPQTMSVSSIADSLGAPMAAPFSLGLIQRYVDRVACVADDDLRVAMVKLAETLNLLAEPACTASLAGALGPLAPECENKCLGLIACGSNISVERWQRLLQR